jgi:hypothetical protein
VLAGREGLGREGLRGRKVEEAGRKGGEGSRRGAVGVWGGRGAGGRRREGIEDAKETKNILQKNKSTMLDDLGTQKFILTYSKHKNRIYANHMRTYLKTKNL